MVEEPVQVKCKQLRNRTFKESMKRCLGVPKNVLANHYVKELQGSVEVCLRFCFSGFHGQDINTQLRLEVYLVWEPINNISVI